MVPGVDSHFILGGDEVASDDWGSSILVPILREETRCENYRGISLIDVAVKISAIVILRRLQAVRDPGTRPNQAVCTPTTPDEALSLLFVLTLTHFTLYHSGPRDSSGRHGVATALSQQADLALLAWEPVNDQMAYVRLKSHFTNISIVSVYAPSSAAERRDKEAFYLQL
ncbi:hypothetical protein SprV_0100014600 [Sparganum proliferum]